MHNESGRFCPLRSTAQENGQDLNIQSRGPLWSLDNWNSQWFQSQIKKAATEQICQIQAERTSHAHVPPHQPLWAPARHGGEPRIPTGPGKVHGGAGGTGLSGGQCAVVPGWPETENLQQQLWVGQSRAFTQVWWNLSKKTAWRGSRRKAESEERELQVLIVLRSAQRHIGNRCNGRGWWPKIRQAEPSQRRQGERGTAGRQLLPLHQGLRLQSPHRTLIPRCLIEEKKSERLRLSMEEERVHLKVTFLPWMGKIMRKWRPVLHLEETEVMVYEPW